MPNPETRRSGGMHYTSIKNIHKVIDPLFLDDLTRITMPIVFRKFHAANDAAVMKAYGYSSFMTETEIVADLMRRCQELTM